MTANLQPRGRVGLNEQWQWSVDGIELEPRKRLKLQIGGHWIMGTILRTNDGKLLWLSWSDWVSIPITYYLRAKWPKEDDHVL